MACPVGKFRDDNSLRCNLCEKGSYQDEEGKANCKTCSEGKTTKWAGATSSKECYKGDFKEKGNKLWGHRYAVLSSKYWVCFVKGTTRKNYGYSLDYIVNGIYCLLKISFIANFKHCSRRTQYIGNWQTNKHAGNFPRYSVSYVKAPRFNLPRGSLNIIQLCYVLNSNLKNLFHSPRRKKYFHQKESRTRW